MTASPFWKKVMRVTGVLCFVTLMTTPVFYIKYFIFDRSVELALAQAPVANAQALPLKFRYTELFRNRAVTAPEPSDRIQAVHWLHDLIQQPYSRLTHPNERNFAEMTLDTVAANDKDPQVRVEASKELGDIATGGAFVRR